jgi:hypothetical protein
LSTIWNQLDSAAAKVDNAKPKASDRDWTKGNRKPDKDAEEHYRRYASNEAQKIKIRHFLENIRDRLAQVPDGAKNQPLPFSLPYVGWSRVVDKRSEQHNEHQGGSAIKK